MNSGTNSNKKVRWNFWVGPEEESKEYFWIICAVIQHRETAILENLLDNICNLFSKRAYQIRIEFGDIPLACFKFMLKGYCSGQSQSHAPQSRTYGYRRCSVISIHNVYKHSQPVAKSYHYILLIQSASLYWKQILSQELKEILKH